MPRKMAKKKKRTKKKKKKKTLINIEKKNKKKKKKTKKKLWANIFDEYRHKNSQQHFSQLNSTTSEKYHTQQPSGIHPRFTRMVQHTQINQCHTPH